MKFPFVPRELVEYLHKAYPNRCPALSDSDREVWFKAGQASVVTHLEEQLKYQEYGDQDRGSLPDVLRLSSTPSGAGPADDPAAGSTAVRTPGSTGNRLGGDSG